jgi:hypothetical protein
MINAGVVPSQVDADSVRIVFGTFGGVSKHVIDTSWYSLFNQFSTSLIVFFLVELLYRWRHRHGGQLSSMGILFRGVDGRDNSNITNGFRHSQLPRSFFHQMYAFLSGASSKARFDSKQELNHAQIVDGQQGNGLY